MPRPVARNAWSRAAVRCAGVRNASLVACRFCNPGKAGDATAECARGERAGRWGVARAACRVVRITSIRLPQQNPDASHAG